MASTTMDASIDTENIVDQTTSISSESFPAMAVTQGTPVLTDASASSAGTTSPLPVLASARPRQTGQRDRERDGRPVLRAMTTGHYRIATLSPRRGRGAPVPMRTRATEADELRAEELEMARRLRLSEAQVAHIANRAQQSMGELRAQHDYMCAAYEKCAADSQMELSLIHI